MANKIKIIGMVGAGTMGRQIAAWSVPYGYTLRLYNRSSETLEKTKKYMVETLGEEKKEYLERITYHTDLFETIKDADLVIESISERLELKKEIFSKIDKAAPPHAIIATNSSSFPVSKIEDAVERKDKVLNIHFYILPRVPMVDILGGTKTSKETFQKGKEWLESIECVPLVVKKECLGFVFNRVWRAVKKEVLAIWAGGYADFKDVDKAWKLYTGMKMGPFEIMDGIGLDVVYDIEMSYYKESGDPKDKPPQALKDLIDKGILGTKSGKGFYDW